MKACNQCGKCCINYSDGGLSATAEEIAHWEAYRPDIFEYVSEAGDIWVDPTTQTPLRRCPWLRQVPGQSKYTCDIYAERPGDCRYYPVAIEHMIADGCEMLEAHDLKRPKQAQRELDRLMADSRPPLE